MTRFARFALVAWLVALLVACAEEKAAPKGSTADRPTPTSRRWTFDDLPTGSPPKGWRIEATAGLEPGAVWSVVHDDTAPSPRGVLALTEIREHHSGTFNLCWTDEVRLRDVEVQVAVRMRSGEEDQGGGPMWRVQAANDYYLCRWNPLERNFRVYVVANGRRRQLASADVDLPRDAWHRIAVRHVGERIECSLDGKRLLEATDATIPGEGGVGVWTKADAATAFDDLAVAPATP